jgi:hypothetical protein
MGHLPDYEYGQRLGRSSRTQIPQARRAGHAENGRIETDHSLVTAPLQSNADA